MYNISIFLFLLGILLGVVSIYTFSKKEYLCYYSGFIVCLVLSVCLWVWSTPTGTIFAWHIFIFWGSVATLVYKAHEGVRNQRQQ